MLHTFYWLLKVYDSQVSLMSELHDEFNKLFPEGTNILRQINAIILDIRIDVDTETYDKLSNFADRFLEVNDWFETNNIAVALAKLWLLTEIDVPKDGTLAFSSDLFESQIKIALELEHIIGGFHLWLYLKPFKNSCQDDCASIERASRKAYHIDEGILGFCSRHSDLSYEAKRVPISYREANSLNLIQTEILIVLWQPQGRESVRILASMQDAWSRNGF